MASTEGGKRGPWPTNVCGDLVQSFSHEIGLKFSKDRHFSGNGYFSMKRSSLFTWGS